MATSKRIFSGIRRLAYMAPETYHAARRSVIVLARRSEKRGAVRNETRRGAAPRATFRRVSRACSHLAFPKSERGD